MENRDQRRGIFNKLERLAPWQRRLVCGTLGVSVLTVCVVTLGRHLPSLIAASTRVQEVTSSDGETSATRSQAEKAEGLKLSIRRQFRQEKEADARRWGVAISSDAFDELEGDAYYYKHGQLDSTGLPLAGGGVVGRDDWRTINKRGKPTAQQIMDEDNRSDLFFREIRKKNPALDARRAAKNGDWKFYILPIRWRYLYNEDGTEAPVKFEIIGLRKIFGCKLSEQSMRKYGKRTLGDYYDNVTVVVPSRSYGPAGRGSELIQSRINKSDSNYKKNANYLIKKYEAEYNSELFKHFKILERARQNEIMDLREDIARSIHFTGCPSD